MQLHRTHLFMIIASAALLTVLVIQVNWIFETARIKEALFNEKANMVIARTTEALYADKQTARQISENVRTQEMLKIDSLLNYYMRYYNFHIDYTYKIIRPDQPFKNRGTSFVNCFAETSSPPVPADPRCHQKNLNELANKNGWELKLVFPEKKQFIMAEMGSLFITSIILVIVVILLFRYTILSLMKEKKIWEHTTDFLNNMTHEFKTPLTNIALAGKMISKEQAFRQDDKLRHYSGIIRDENEKLIQQVEQVLSMSAFERGEIRLQTSELDLHKLIHDAIQCINIQVENRKGELDVKLHADKFVIMGDRLHLTNALCNLVDNAIKYSGDRPQISIQTVLSGFNIMTIITDHGVGIEKAYQKKVFDKFFRVPTGDVHDVKGFGLGLAYTKKIIELHKGTIELQSEKGKGTTFIITLPHVEG